MAACALPTSRIGISPVPRCRCSQPRPRLCACRRCRCVKERCRGIRSDRFGADLGIPWIRSGSRPLSRSASKPRHERHGPRPAPVRLARRQGTPLLRCHRATRPGRVDIGRSPAARMRAGLPRGRIPREAGDRWLAPPRGTRKELSAPCPARTAPRRPGSRRIDPGTRRRPGMSRAWSRTPWCRSRRSQRSGPEA